MKKLFLTIALSVAGMGFSQYYPNNGGYTSEGYYGGEYYNDQYSYPDDYYYEFPDDYYDDGYYNSYYNDYRNSIVRINWDRFFVEFNLSPIQIREVVYLNNRFKNFGQWNRYYRHNPDRWYYDRYFALERILGAHVYISFQKRYYRGYSPIVYFQNHKRNYYGKYYAVRPAYKHRNIMEFRTNNGFRGNAGHNSGWNDNRQRNYGNSNGDQGGFRREQSQTNTNNGGFRNESRSSDKVFGGGNQSSGDRGGFRNQSQGQSNSSQGGFRSGSSGEGGFRNNGNRTEKLAESHQNNGSGFRSGGFRN